MGKSKRGEGKGVQKDPHFARESLKYEKPIYSREYIMNYLLACKQAPTRHELEIDLKLTDAEQIEALRRRLRAMERDGQILRNRRGQYRLVSKMDLVRGRIQGHKDGFGFIIPDDGSEDCILQARDMRQVFHGDRVLACKEGRDPRGRLCAKIVEVLARNTERVVGRYYNESGVSFVSPDNKRITQDVLIMPGDDGGARPGQFVTAQITMQPSKHNQPIGKVVEVLGDHMAPGMEIDIALRSHAIPWEWPEKVMQEVSQWEKAKQLPRKGMTGRQDLRELAFVTIDGEDARDFDDAVYATANKRGGYCLYVAIADVSYYVKPGSDLDKEALTRGTSVYFPNSVIPMLPEVLSNGWCSLQPEVDRFAVVCEMHINAEGKLQRYDFYPAVIRSQARLTYNQVWLMLQNKDASLQVRFKKILPHIKTLYQLYQVLHKARNVRGAIDFEMVETRIIFDKDRKIKKITPRVRNDAHRLIEECMLMANVAAARLLKKSKLPAIYRVHEPPPIDKIEVLREFLHELGISFKSEGKDTAEFSALLNRVHKRDDNHLIQSVMLRTMSQAVYSPDNVGHFGLAYPAYTHFTSPIRRYPDLLVHRLICHIIQSQTSPDITYTKAALENMAEQCSAAERRADDATRDVEKWLKCEYMLDKVGSEFDGIISGVTSFGFFVELHNIYVDGLVHISSLANDYFIYDAVKHRLRGERTGKCYRLGDKLRVKVARVDLDERIIDFELPQAENPVKNDKKPRKPKRRR